MSALDIVETLGGRWDKSKGYGFASCPCHADKTPSLKIKDGPDGDVILHCFAGCDWKQIKDVLRQKGLLPPLNEPTVPGAALRVSPYRPSPGQMANRRGDHPVDHHLDHGGDENSRIEAARQIWRSTLPAPGTAVETYLRGRGITAPIPASIRYAPSLLHTPTGLLLPTMVAAIQGPDRQIMGIHRTFLRADGKGKVPFTRPKMMLGRCAQGAVRLAKAGPKLAVGEGIESSLSVLQETNIPVWAALSTSGMKALILPPCVREVILCPDADEPGEKAAKEAAQRFISEGRIVRIARPPQGMDFNDVLIASRQIVSLENYRKTTNG